MNKATKKTLALGLILCLILCATLLAACNPKEDNDQPPQTKLETYTVNVTCDDAAALENVKIQVKNENGEKVGEKELTEGKATFELAAANYTATLSGVAEEYAFEDGTLTATDKECTIEVAHVIVYTVSIIYKDVKDIFGNTITPGGPAEGVTVSLYVGQLKDDNLSKLDKPPVLAATTKTDATGKAKFNLPGEMYTVVVSGLAAGQSIDYGVGTNKVLAYTVSLSQRTLNLPLTTTPLGKNLKNTIPLKLGENQIKMTAEGLAPPEKVDDEETLGMGCYSFTAAEAGTYTFTTTGSAQIFDTEMMPIIRGEGTFTRTLKKGEKLILLYLPTNINNMEYTITIAKSAESN